MRSIAILNQKGGVGKTTTAVNVGAGMARTGVRVLLLDLDPQSHATMHVGVDPRDGQPGIYEVLTNGIPAADALREVAENLSVIPASIDLVGAELEIAARPERETILRRALAPLQTRFDVLLIDCPPSLGTLTINALTAVEEVLIPLQPHFLALQGLGRLLETVTLVRGVLNPTLRVSGIVLCLYEAGTRLAAEVAGDVRAFIEGSDPDDAWHGARVFDRAIRRNIKLAECPSFGQTVFDYAPHCHGAEDYAALAREILAMTTDTPDSTVVRSATADTADLPAPPAPPIEETMPQQTPDALVPSPEPGTPAIAPIDGNP